MNKIFLSSQIDIKFLEGLVHALVVSPYHRPQQCAWHVHKYLVTGYERVQAICLSGLSWENTFS